MTDLRVERSNSLQAQALEGVVTVLIDSSVCC